MAALRSRDWKHKTGYTYGLHGTPTTFTLEARMATLEGGKFCTLVPSGLAAVVLVDMALLKAGDEVLIPDNAYGPNRAFAEAELAAWGISCQFYDAMNPADLAAKLNQKSRLVWLEAPGSITLEFPDLPALVAVVKSHNASPGQAHPEGAVTALDNTWGAGLAFCAFDFDNGQGVDVSVQALTKYPSGGGDVLMGSIITRNQALHDRIKLTHMRLGLGVGANDTETVLRSLPSIDLRYRAHDAGARTLARWMQGRAEVVQVLHPALEGSPGHAHWRALCAADGSQGLAAGLFSVVLNASYSPAQVDALCDALRLFRLGYSWGGPISLVVPYELKTMRSTWPAHLAQGTVVRFSVGLESVADLRADLAQALEKLAA